MEYESKLVVPNKWDDPKPDLCIPTRELVKPLMDPAFFSMRSYSMVKLVFYLFVKILIFRKNLDSPLIFVLFF